jgi:hypothetical protein
MLAEHLHSRTYWEKRAELAESAVFQLIKIIAREMRPDVTYVLRDFMDEWNDKLTELAREFPPPSESKVRDHVHTGVSDHVHTGVFDG